MSLDRKIQKITLPTIELDEMSMANTDDPDGPVYSKDSKVKQSGSLFPLVQINRYKFGANELSAFELDLTGFLPRCRVSVASGDGVFLSKSYPKDGDPMSVFIRSRTDTFNPIRCDFEIDTISSFPSKESSGDVVAYTIEGTLRVPRLYAEFCRSYRDMTSYEALQEIATDMKLGYATNTTETDDRMTWLQPFDPTIKFIGDVTKASYKDDDSFFTTWIDHYYNLNFVNVNTQFGEDFEIEDALDVLNAQKDYNEGHELNEFDTKLVLSNHKNLRGHGDWISGYTLVNNCGDVVKANGYRRYTQFYDRSLSGDPKDKYQSYFIEPLTTEGAEDVILLRGRTKEPEVFAEQNKNKFMGIQNARGEYVGDGPNGHKQYKGGSVHGNYLHAKVNNWQNKQEIEKMVLHISLVRCNFNLYRGQRVPVIILNTGGNIRQKTTQDPEITENTPMSLDKFLSGYYYIIGMKVRWDEADGAFYQDVFLSRREWPIPHQSTENIAQG